MKFATIAFLFLVCVSICSHSLSLAADVECQAKNTCSAMDDHCDLSWSHNVVACMEQRGQGCCAFGLNCSNSRCIYPSVYGKQCYSDRDCLSGSIERSACVKGICQSEVHSGDSCRDEDDCPHPMKCDSKKGVCRGAKKGTQCRRDQDCDIGMFCGDDLECVSRRGLGMACDFNSQCTMGSQCIRWSCTLPFTLKEGDKCDYSQECADGALCIHQECRSVSLQKICTSDSDCSLIDGSYCSCSDFTGVSRCTSVFHDDCSAEKIQVEGCMKKRGCGTLSLGHGSCAMRECRGAATRLGRCRCENLKKQFSGCFFDQFCQAIGLE
eukprot:TRINITY_DN12548_c0_g1_i1.p1 TRINITY_DN12548_c0_g1~~TRINITY_DN12548_c0_g1_i1.p1  ORF type:complete len:324 (+),score=10.13 TRINITY_DN12548_c0_g1_i1:1-972(+)